MRPHDVIPNAYRDVPYDAAPPGYAIGDATMTELRVAGFHGGPEAEPEKRWPGIAPAEEYLVEGTVADIPVQAIVAFLERAVFIVLRDETGAIVATWDEGRWWTPSESEAYTAVLVAELRNPEGGDD